MTNTSFNGMIKFRHTPSGWQVADVYAGENLKFARSMQVYRHKLFVYGDFTVKPRRLGFSKPPRFYMGI